MSLNLGAINEAIADAVPERPAIITPRRRFTWREFQMRSRRLANLLTEAGFGCDRERADLAPWESGQDHVALYLYNGNEYLEGMIGASKARTVPFNVNYRYVADELAYLFKDSAARGIIYHASFAPLLREVLAGLPKPPSVLLQVEDGSGEALLPGARDYEQALAASSDAPPSPALSADDLYMLYTGGTTGAPKGVLWRQEDIFFTALGGRMIKGGNLSDAADLGEVAKSSGALTMLAAPPFMHGAGHWSAFIFLHQGGAVCTQTNPRALDPDDIWSTVEREHCLTLSIVGDAFARPLLDQLARKKYDLSALKIIGSGGAILSPPLKDAILEALPGVMIVDGFGSSETGAQGSTVTMAGGHASQGVFTMDEQTVVLDPELQRVLDPSETEVLGWLARRGRVPLGYLGDEAKTKRTYPTIGGTRYSVPGDRARVEGNGTIHVLGRDSVCINSGGEKIFAEEVEQALKHHPAVYDAVVTGTPNERWGEQVTALVMLRPGSSASPEELRETAAKHLARYKLPKDIVFVDTMTRAPSGKPDYRWAKTTALEALGGGAPP